MTEIEDFRLAEALGTLPPGTSTQNLDIANDIARRQRGETRNQVFSASLTPAASFEQGVIRGTPPTQVFMPETAPEVTAAGIHDESRTGSYIVRNAEIRETGRIKVLELIEHFEQMEGQEFERVMVDEYLIPSLRRMTALLELRTDSIDEILAARKELERTASMLAKVQVALSKAPTIVIAGLVGNAAWYITQAALGLH